MSRSQSHAKPTADHSLKFSTCRDELRVNTEVLFECSCREWRIEVLIPDAMMNAFDGRGFGHHLVKMGLDAGQQFERHRSEMEAAS